VLVLLLAIGLMVWDMYQQKELDSNPFEYSIDQFKKIEVNQYCYELTGELKADFKKLKAVTIDQDDQIIVGDSATITIFSKAFEPIQSFDLEGEISCLHAGQDGLLYAGMNGHVEVWNKAGKMVEAWPSVDLGSIITSIVSFEDQVFVADAGKKLIHQYNVDGAFIKSFGKKDSVDRKFGFLIPSPYFDVDLDREGHIWATNPGLHTLEAFTDDGRFVSSWNRTSMGLDGFSGCCNPIHFAFLSDGGFVTSEKGLVRVKIHDPTGDFRCAVDGADSFDEKETGLDIAVNSLDDIFILVPSEHAVRKYSLH
jgi:hypothetical protein